MRRIICTIIFGFSLGVLMCFFFNDMNSFKDEAKAWHSRPNNIIDGAILLGNVEKNVGEGEGALFTPFPHMEGDIMENELQDV